MIRAMLAATMLLSACDAGARVETGRAGTDLYAHPGGALSVVPRRMQRLPGPVRVVGTCASACTALLARADVCTAPDAVWQFHGAQIAGEYAGLTARDAEIAGWYARWPGLAEWFAAGDLSALRSRTGAEMNARHGVPLCGEGR